MSSRRRDLRRELVNAEQALADAKARLAYEQASRRRFEAEYRAEALEQFEDDLKRSNAEAWEQGYRAGYEHGDPLSDTDFPALNPYRGGQR